VIDWEGEWYKLIDDSNTYEEKKERKHENIEKRRKIKRASM